ncbi:hypothetical protein [Brevundimonas sp. Root1279]|uniref:hypothetical protein n=1 Tax=Brevundimonas sp. Root1279 TaxID=1736443 RepID=UPI0007007B8A|nr:hypothetical protein [Brevundimonas sp. Root1279]KQW79710.1 hypothetical protein ASC65_14270 [Brevundimonas sp. Root1279]
MDAAHVAALQAPAPTKCTLVRFDLPGGALLLTDGGFVEFDAGEGEGPETYVGRDPTYGTLDTVPSIKDGAEAQTTRIDIALLPASDTAVAALASPTLQGVRVQWWEGAIDDATGQLIGEPELKFDGELDRARFSVGERWGLVMECGTQAERQLEPNADWRLNHSFHSLIWPGEKGLIFVDGVTRKKEWRERPENPGVVKRFLRSLTPWRDQG